jgi:hypothetical protein
MLLEGQFIAGQRGHFLRRAPGGILRIRIRPIGDVRGGREIRSRPS